MKKLSLAQIEKEVIGKRFDHALPIEPITRAAGEGDNRTVQMAVTSDKPILHWFGYLILNHSAAAIDLTRVNAGAPLLLEHDREEKIGGLFNFQTDGHVLRCDAKFSKRPKAEAEYQDLQDGIGRMVSGGFLVHHLVLVEERENDYDVYRCDDWEPIEASLVSIPADISVGIGRALEARSDDVDEDEMNPAVDETAPKAIPDEDELEQAETQPETQRANNAPIIMRNLAMENDNELLRIGETFGEVELARDYALANKTSQELRDAILAKRTASQTPTPKPLIELNEREIKQYSIARAILADATIRDGGKDNCFEMEVSREIERCLPSTIKRHGGVYVPTIHDREMLQRAGLDTKTSTKGQTTVFTEFGGFIDLLRNKMKVAALGATMLPGLQGNVGMPRQTGAGSFSWVAENPGSDVADSDLTLDQVTMSPKIGQSTTSYSRTLLAQASVSIDNLVTSDLAAINALAIDRAAIHGTGASNQPTGLYAQSGLNTVAMGGAITFAKLVAMETAIAAANGDISTMAYLTTSGARGNAKTTQKFASTNGVPIWENGEMNGYRAEASNQVSSVMLASAATGGSEHGILFGCWDQLLIGEWGAMELITDPYRLKKQGMIEVTSFVMVDIAVRQPAAFAKGTGLTVS